MKTKISKQSNLIILLLFILCSLNPYKAQSPYLLGTTQGGGAINNSGVAFSCNLNTSAYNATSFDGSLSSGARPNGSFMLASDGNIYGLSVYNSYGFAAIGYGHLVKYDPASSSITPIVNFTGVSGASPGGRAYGSVIESSPGVLSGMTSAGGTNGSGVIFSYTLSSNTYSVLYNFDNSGTEGYQPYGSLLKASDGLLYGMTRLGGVNGNGVVFSFNTATSTYTTLVDFTGNSGVAMGGVPIGSLIEPVNGVLYGLTNVGGTDDVGVLFSYKISTGAYLVKYSFSATSGGDTPSGSLVKVSNGKLYGLAANSGSVSTTGFGVLFEFDPAGAGTYTPKFDFNSTNGESPRGSLIEASNGKLYGTTYYGGASGNGVIFGYDLSTTNPTVMINFSGSSGTELGKNPNYGQLLEYSFCQLPIVTTAQVNLDCDGGSNASATITATGGGPYTYTWSPTGGNAAVANNLSGITYTCATANSCGVTNQTISISAPPAITLSALPNLTLVCTGNSSTITAIANGGTGPYTYTWTAGPSNNSITIVTPTATTNYTIDINDALGCAASQTVTVATSICTGLSSLSGVEILMNVYPIPSTGVYTIDAPAKTKITVTNVLGKVIYTQQLEEGKQSLDLSNFANGLYILNANIDGNSKTVRLIKE